MRPQLYRAAKLLKDTSRWQMIGYDREQWPGLAHSEATRNTQHRLEKFRLFSKNIFLEPLAQFDRGQPVRISCASPASSRCDRLYPLNTPVRACAVAGRQGVLDFAQMASEAERGA